MKQFSLKAKFVAVVALLGFIMACVAVVVFYIAFKAAVESKMESDLLNEADKFVPLLVPSDSGTASVIVNEEWTELEHTKVAPYARYVILTDSHFNTIHKTENLGRMEFQTFYDFKPLKRPETISIQMDQGEYMCAVVPVLRQGSVLGYVLSAGDFAQIDKYEDIFENTIALSFIILIVVGVALASLLAERITKPLTQIRNMAARIDLDNLGGRIRVDASDREVQNMVDALNRLLERLEKSFQQINEFSSNVSHELRTPLTVLRGNIEVGMSRDRSKEEYVQILSELQEETLHIIRIVDDMLLLARADARSLRMDKERISLTQFCHDFTKEWELMVSEKRQKLICSLDGEMTIEGNSHLLYQLVLNLISNASKYSAEKTVIRAGIRKVSDEQGISFAEIRISDEGPGIPEHEQEKVFERFYRVNKDRSRETGGTGLGLPICKMIADLHGGIIKLESLPNKGTTVLVRIPTV